MLFLHRSERADALLGVLAEQLKQPLPDPMSAEIISVPSRGIERWIAQGLATHLGVGAGSGNDGGVSSDGIAANIDWIAPAALVRDVVSLASGVQPQDDPWSNGQLLWTVAEVVDANLEQPWLRLVADQIAAGAVDQRTDRMATLLYINDLFVRYHWQRPQMIQSWSAGRDVDQLDQPLAADDLWQPRLWREVRALLGTPSPPERLQQVVNRIVAGEVELDLPPRLHVFGLTQLLPTHAQVIGAIASRLQVHVYLLHPSAVLWDVIAQAGAVAMPIAREADPTADLVANPLIASWARDSRELQPVLQAVGQQLQDQYHPPSLLPLTLLGRVQQDVLANAEPAGATSPSSELPLVDLTTDRSLQVHACHGASRQVQVLRDAIMQAFEDDRTLEPRDVVIMCPDVETFAPHIQAVFGEVPELRVRLADRAAATTNPLVAAMVAMLELADSRCTASEVMAFLHHQAVRRKFNLTDDDLDRVLSWVESAGIRWGLSAQHRSRWGLGEIEKDTWIDGLNRLVLGVAMADEDLRTVGGVAPIDDVTSTDIELVGRLLHAIAQLETMVNRFTGTFTVDQAIELVGQSVDELMEVTWADSWQRVDMLSLLQRARAVPAAVTGISTALGLNEFRDLLELELAGRPSRSNFRTGNVTVCTLTPMRSVPHRVVCLLGLDDGSFPRKGRTSRDDLSSRLPLVGDHDPRGEDRQLFMDALLAATDRLVITYSGRDERTNDVRPPAVPVAELLTVVDQTVRFVQPQLAEESPLVIFHPLQAFDSRNFTVGELGTTQRPFSFDSDAWEGAVVQNRGLAETADLVTWHSTDLAEIENVSLDELVEFICHPAKFYLRRRLNLQLRDYHDQLDDELTVGLNHLQKWAVGTHLLDELVAADPSTDHVVLARWRAHEFARGGFPAGRLAAEALDEQADKARVIAARVRQERDGQSPRTLPIHVTLPDGQLLYGSVSGVAGDTLITHSMSQIRKNYKGAAHSVIGKAKPQLTMWIKLLALAVAYPEVDWQAVLVGCAKAAKKGMPPQADIARMSLPEHPAEVLQQLIGLYRRGLVEPLPLIPESSQAYAMAAAHEAAARRNLNAVYVTGFVPRDQSGNENEDRDADLVAAFGPRTVDDLLTDRKFIHCSCLVWQPLLDNVRFGAGR